MTEEIGGTVQKRQSRDELADKVDRLETLLHKQIEKRKALEETVDEQADRVDELEAANEELRAELEDVGTKATAAVRMLTESDSDESKTEYAKRLTRNMLISRAASNTTGTRRAVTIATIQERAEESETGPSEVAWAIVDRAWDQLCDKWEAFYGTTKEGQNALNVRPSQVTEPLATIVQTDLGREGLAKRFVDEKGEEGEES